MKKIVKSITVAFGVLCCLVFAFIVSGEYILPENVVFYDGQESVKILSVFTAEKKYISEVNDETDKSAEISLFGVLPVATVAATETQRQYVYIGGHLIGIRLYTEGILVVGTDSVDTPEGAVKPADEAGIRQGDIITKAGGNEIDSVSSFIRIINSADGSGVNIEVLRENKTINLVLTPEFSVTENKYRCGLWLRDSTAGIGTMTFADPSSGVVASLGHAICDSETGAILPVGEGDILDAQINGCIAGKKGSTGQIKGNFSDSIIGNLISNNKFGVYGTYSEADYSESMLYPVASQTEIKTGMAQIISTVTSEGPEFYDAEIERITYSEDNAVRSIVIRVTDEDLISVTGGIIQGMSGSPIIQDGMLVGAVTHVFLNDPTRGYGIFAETMLSVGREIAD